jgi:hypothetical protein
MAMFQLNMAAIALELALHDPAYEPMVHRFGQDFVIVANVLQRTGGGGAGLWNEEHQFYFDMIRHETERVPLEVYSMVGLVPLFAAVAIEASSLQRLPSLMQTVGDVLERREFVKSILPSFIEPGQHGTRLLSVVDGRRLRAVLQRVLDETQFLSDYGVRSLSRAHGERPYEFTVGGRRYDVAYQPGVSDNRMFGGNSNWRGPIWFPMNFLLIQALATSARYYGDAVTVECPSGSGRFMTLAEVADELSARLTRLFLRDERSGRRAVLGENDYVQNDLHWRDCVPFHEFFHGDTGAGLGAGHQTGWTALVALLIQHGGRLCFDELRADVGTARAATVQEGKVA